MRRNNNQQEIKKKLKEKGTTNIVGHLNTVKVIIHK